MLDRILPNIPKTSDPRLIVGVDTLDDAGVFQLNPSQALVQTVDFFTPIVDDPYDFGRIAAANSLSDVYAMGGQPLTVLNILAFPSGDLPEDVLLEILTGSADVCKLAGAVIAGGHSVTDNELKFGLSVTGLVHPKQMLTNSNACAGDILILTKPLGTGLVSNALMNNAASEEMIAEAVVQMVRLNKVASEIGLEFGAHAATDITGFGFLGHAMELAKASGVTLRFDSGSIPCMKGARSIAESGSYYSGGERRNQQYTERSTVFSDAVGEPIQRLLVDPQTSGGLLISLEANKANAFISAMADKGEEAWIVGDVTEFETNHLRVQ